MSAAANVIPDGYHSVTPYLIVKGAGGAIDFYRQAFGPREVMRLEGPDGVVRHAELQIGSSRIMLADEQPELQALSPPTIGGSPVSLHLYVDDVDTPSRAPLLRERGSFGPWRISSMATVPAASRIPSAIAGSSRPTRKS